MHSLPLRSQSDRVDSLRTRLIAGAVHLMLSLLVASASAVLVFFVWFPGDFREMAGGRDLYLLMMSVDVVMGPMLTIAIFDLRKGWPVLRRDLAVLAMLQLVALGYGMYVSASARPVALVFEVDRFKVVVANSILIRELAQADPPYRSLPWTGPWTLGTRSARPDLTFESVDLAMQGFDLAQRPSYWQPYDLSRASVLKKARPFSDLLRQHAGSALELQQRLEGMGVAPSEARFIPVTSTKSMNWVAILRANGDVVGYAPVDGFF